MVIIFYLYFTGEEMEAQIRIYQLVTGGTKIEIPFSMIPELILLTTLLFPFPLPRGKKITTTQERMIAVRSLILKESCAQLHLQFFSLPSPLLAP